MCQCNLLNWDYDKVFAYRTNRTVQIRDKRLGLTMMAIQVGIFAYVFLYQLIAQQNYRVVGQMISTSRIQLLEPSSQYRWPDQGAPYCLGVQTSVDPAYTFPQAGSYAYRGNIYLQFPCTYYDAVALAGASELEANSVFLPTRIKTDLEIMTPTGGVCDYLNHSYCAWNSSSSSTTYVPDAEFFTLQIDHAFVSSINLARTSAQMTGYLLDTVNQPVDPCVAYTSNVPPMPCPSFVNVGELGSVDVIPLRALLLAGGVSSGTLDELASPFNAVKSLIGESQRYAGSIILVGIHYTNYMLPSSTSPFSTKSFDGSVVQYFYTVHVLADDDYKNEQPINTNSGGADLPAITRTLYDAHGVRIIVSLDGRVGGSDFQAALVNLTSALGLLAVAIILTDWLMMSCCPLRNIYRQYKERVTIDFDDLRATADHQTVIARFTKEENLVDPIPPVIHAAFLTSKTRQRIAASNQVKAAGVQYNMVRDPPTGLMTMQESSGSTLAYGMSVAAQPQQQQQAAAEHSPPSGPVYSSSSSSSSSNSFPPQASQGSTGPVAAGGSAELACYPSTAAAPPAATANAYVPPQTLEHATTNPLSAVSNSAPTAVVSANASLNGDGLSASTSQGPRSGPITGLKIKKLNP